MIASLKRGVWIASVLLAVGACSAAGPDDNEAPEQLGTTRLAWGPGGNGPGNITAPGTIVNFYSNVTNNLAAGATQINVGSMADLGPPQVGDLVMIMQMQGAIMNVPADPESDQYGNITNLGGAGTFELAHVQSIQGNTLTIENGCGGLKQAYSAAGHTQVIRVPEYTTLTLGSGASIVPRPWNGQRGGVVAIRASGAITLNGSSFIDATGFGFRGGELDNAGSSMDVTSFYGSAAAGGAQKGESIAGFTAEYAALGGAFGRGAPANGGGGGNAHNAGGGGGANGNPGGTWTGQGIMLGAYAPANDPWRLDPAFIANGNARTTSTGGGRGGYTYSSANRNAVTEGPGAGVWGGDDRREVGGWGGRPLNAGPQAGQPIRYFLGGGGGAGDSNNSAGTAGANGGGLVFIQAASITGNGGGGNAIRANGDTAASTSPGHNDAPGGGGAGGSIVIVSPTLTGINLTANGGAGGKQLITNNEAEGPGGGGGGGYIAVTAGTSPARTANGGAGGTTTSTGVTEFVENGATSAGNGLPTATALTLAQLDALTCYFDYPPTNTAPASRTVVEDGTLTFAGGNQISIADIDARGQTLKVTLTATHGAITLPGNTSGVTFQTGDGTSDPQIVMTGTLAALNTAMLGLQYKPDANYFGPATLTIVTDDQGATGPTPATPKTATSTVAITVTPVNDPPVIQDDTASAIPGIPVTINVLANDSDPDGDTLTVTAVGAPGKGTATKNADNTITYLVPVGQTGTDTFTYTVSDGTVTATATVTVTIGGTDTDGDGLPDAFEDLIGTDKNDADSDDDGVKDGDEIKPNEDTDGDGLINALDPDSDNDGLFDGTEMGKGCSDPATDTSKHHCRPDADPSTTTDPLNRDTDGGGKSDGSEDFNLDGKLDPGEGDPTVGHGADDASIVDTDGDGLSDKLEELLGSNPNDKDSDDDGVLDGDEPNPSDDTDGDGLLNVLDPDSDNDGLFDGTEMGRSCSDPATDNAKKRCIADEDPATKTSPLLWDTDRGGVSDGSEDANRNGKQDATETDPTAGHGADDTDPKNKDTDGDGLSDAFEDAIGSNKNDKDSDDDGVPDGEEPNPAEDTDGDGKPNVIDPDSDGDGLFDGTEMGKGCDDPATDTSKNQCIADADPSTKTNPLDPDTDKGGVKDGTEDTNHNGKVDAGERDPLNPLDDNTVGPGGGDADGDGLSDEEERRIGTNPNDADSDDDGVLDGDEIKPGEDTDGDGLINALDADSDNDGLFDGTEMGKNCSHPATDLTKKRCVPDADPSTTTDPLNRDTDGGGVTDGSEDANRNGKQDGTETDPTAGHGADDKTDPNKDTDGDGLSDAFEDAIGSNKNDKDSDDDGVLDGDEPNPAEDTDGDGKPNIIDPDSDGDGLFDGTEMGKGCDDPATDTSKNQCIADADPSTKTSPLDPDTDHGSVKDGDEDANHNGKVDPGERDPLDPSDDLKKPTDPYGGTSDGGASSGAAVPPVDEGSLEGGGVSCASAPGETGSSLAAFGLVGLGLALARRRRRAA